MILKFFLGHWEWIAGAVGVLLLVGMLLNPAVGLTLIANLVKLVPRAASAFLAWIRKPHDWWRIGFGALAVALATSALYVTSLRREIVFIREHERVAVAECKAEVGKLETVSVATTTALKTCKTTLTAEVGRRQQIEQTSRQAVKDARATAAAAQRELDDWRKRYERKPASCTAALKQVEEQCQSLSDF